MATSEIVIELDDVSKSFGGVAAVRHVSLGVRAGEFVSLVGPSGCGKTTTLMMLAGFVRPDSGSISLNGRTISTATATVPPEKRGMSMVFQSYANWPHLTVYANIVYGLRLRRVPKPEIRRRYERVAELVQLPPEMTQRYPAELSGGQQQRVALARALIVDPVVMLFDEPLSNLDARLREQMRGELRRLHRETGMTFVYVTHDREEALAMSDRVVVMRSGHVHQLGTPETVFSDPATPFVARFVGSHNTAAGSYEAGLFRVGGMRIPCPSQGPTGPPAGAGTLTVRRDGLQLANDPLEDGFACEVVSVSYLGVAVEYGIAFEGLLWHAWQDESSPRFEEGQRVYARVRGSHVYKVFPGEEEQAG